MDDRNSSPDDESVHDHREHDDHDRSPSDDRETCDVDSEQTFRRRFFVSTLLSIPVLLYCETLQEWPGWSVSAVPGSQCLNPVFAVTTSRSSHQLDS